MRRGPCDLQIEAAGIGVAVDELARKIQAVLLDTSGMTLQESIDAILKLIRKKVTV